MMIYDYRMKMDYIIHTNVYIIYIIYIYILYLYCIYVNPIPRSNPNYPLFFMVAHDSCEVIHSKIPMVHWLL